MLSVLTGEAAGETGWLECPAAAMLKEAERKKIHTPVNFPSRGFCQVLWFPRETFILKWNRIPSRERICSKTALNCQLLMVFLYIQTCQCTLYQYRNRHFASISEAISLCLTLPSWFADRLNINMHSYILLRSLLTTVKGCHHNLVALLLVVAQPLCISDVTWRKQRRNNYHYSQTQIKEKILLCFF